MKFKELLDSCDPDLLPELKVTEIPAPSAKRIKKLVSAQLETPEFSSSGKRSIGHRITSILTAAAALAGLVIGLRIALIPERGDLIASIANGLKQIFTREEELIDPHAEFIKNRATDAEGKTRITAVKLFGDGEQYYLRLRVDCEAIKYRLIMHGGITLEKDNELIFSLQGYDIDDTGSTKQIAAAIMAGDIWTQVEPGAAGFEFDIKLNQSKLTDGDYILTIGSLYSADLDPEGDNSGLQTELICKEITLPLTLKIPETALDKVEYSPNTVVKVGNEALGLVDLRVNTVTITPLKMHMELSFPYNQRLENPTEGFTYAESYFFPYADAHSDINSNYSYRYYLEYRNEAGELCSTGNYSMKRLTMTDKYNIPFQLEFEFDEPVLPGDIVKIIAIAQRDIPYDRPIDLEKDNFITLWEQNN